MSVRSLCMRDAHEDEDSHAGSGSEKDIMSGSEVQEEDQQQSDDDGGGSGSCGLDSGDEDEGDTGGGSSDEGADLGALDEGTAGGSGSKSSLGYRVITAGSIKRLQQGAIDEVCAIWGCGGSIAKALLMSYMWDKERLMSDLGDKGQERVFKAAGLAVGLSAAAASTSTAAVTQTGGVMTCTVCMSAHPAAQCASNSCGHAFCCDCWQGHLAVQISEGKARHVVCMSYKCGVVCDEELVDRVMQDEPQLLAKYRQSHLESYLEDNPRVAFCPSTPWCGNAIQVESDPYVEPECPCGVSFCFKCRKEPHSPCTCKMWEMWEEKVSGDSETRNWLQANTKPCPKCSKPVEKNGGCNLVVCKCGQPFCWLCGQGTGMAHTWSSIEGHSCGRFKDEMDARMTEAARNHKRYMFYFERFKNHADSIQKEKANRAKLLARIAASEHDGVHARDFSWLVGAVDQLRTARRVLCNSYAFAYFFFGGALFAEDFTPQQNKINQDLFEDNQEMLAAEVERLSGLADRAAEGLSLNADERFTTINSSTNVRTRCANLFSMIEADLLAKVSTLGAHIAVPRF